MKKLLLITLLLGGCQHSPVQSLGADNYLVEAYFTTDKDKALLVLDRRSQNICQGPFSVASEHMKADPFWEDYIVYWEISCGREVI